MKFLRIESRIDLKSEISPEVWDDGVVEVERGEERHQPRNPSQAVVGP